MFTFTNEAFHSITTASQSTGTNTYYLHVQAQDAAGNLSTVSNVYTVLDNTPATLALGAPSLTLVNSANTINYVVDYTDAQNISLSSSDIVFSGASQGCQAAISGTGTQSRVISVTGCSGNGSMRINILANSAQNNMGTPAAASTLSDSVTVDNTAPMLTGLNVDSSPHTSKTWTWGCVESNGPCSYRYLIDTNPTYTFGNETFNSTTTASQLAGTNTYYLHIQAKDVLGNTSTVLTVSTILDGTVPTVSLSAASATIAKSTDTITYTASYTNATTITLRSADITFTGATMGCAASISGSGSAIRTITVSGCAGDGSMQIKIATNSAQSAAGVFATASDLSAVVTVDNTRPILTGLADDSTPHSSKTWTWNCSEINGPCQYRYLISTNPTHTFITEPFSSTTTAIQMSGVNTYYLHVQAKDNAGNISITTTVSTLINNTAASVTLSAPSAAMMKATDTITFTATYIGAANISLANSDIVFTGISLGCMAAVSGTGLTTRTITVTGCLGDGVLQIHIAANSAANSAGIQAAASNLSSAVVIDNTSPQLSGLANEATPLASKTWSWGCIDANGSCTYRFVVNTNSTYLFTNELFSATTTANQSAGANTYYLHIQAKDAVGNISTTTQVSAVINSVLPTISLSNPSATYMNSTSTITYTITYSGAATVSLATTDVIPTGNSSGCSVAVSTASLTTRTLTVWGCAGNGSLQFNIAANSAQNSAGLQAAASNLSGSITVDNTPPQLTGIANDSNPSSSKTWNWSCTDTNGPCTYRFIIDNSNSTYSFTSELFNSTTTVTQNTGSNTYYLHIQAKDAAGNISPETHISAVINNTPPSIDIAVPISSAYINASNVAAYTVSGNCNKEGGSITIKAGATSIGTATCSSSLWSTSSANFTNISEGNISLTAVLTDLAANTATSASVSVTKDVTPPTAPSAILDGTTSTSTTTSPAISFTSGSDSGGSGIQKHILRIISATGTTELKAYATFTSGNVVTGMLLTNGSSYKAQIKAIDNAGNEAIATSDGWTVNISSTVYPPENVTSGATSLTLYQSPSNSWSPPLGGVVAGYQIAIGTSPGGTDTTVGWLDIGNVLTYTVTLSLVNGITYYTSVRSVDSGGTTSAAATGSGWLATTVLPASNITAGLRHTCAIVKGAAQCWGNNTYGQLGDGGTTDRSTSGVVSTLTSGVQALAAGINHTCAIVDGSVKCWGYNDSGQLGNGTTTQSLTPTAVSTITEGAQSIASGSGYSCALVNGGVKCWGVNSYGQLGNASIVSSSTPVEVTGLTSGVQGIAVGYYHTCAIVSGGGVMCWGLNNTHQLGDASVTNRSVPVSVTNLSSGTGIQMIAAGMGHTCVIIDGGAKCWGRNADGELGDGTTTERAAPVAVLGLSSGVQKIWASGRHTCALVNGGIKCWGRNTYGELGDNSGVSQSSPVSVSGLTSDVQVFASGDSHNCAIANSSIKCWGLNTSSQFGDGTTTSSPTPVQMGLTANVVQDLAAGAGGHHTCALVSGGLMCSGYNVYSQIGDATTTSRSSPVAVISLTAGVQSIDGGVGTLHTCALVNGGVKCWGNNGSGQLGNGTTVSISTPYAVTGLSSGVQRVASGSDSTCALVNGGVKCWGYNNYGLLGNGTTVSSLIPVAILGLSSGVQSIAIGTYHACALVNGGVKCWGSNAYGQLGKGTTTQSSFPDPVTGLSSGVQSIASGYTHTCALMNGGVKCWGYNGSGQLGNGTTVNSLIPVAVSGLSSGVQSITAGFYHTCALVNGDVKCWGYNSNGQLGDGTLINKLAPAPTNFAP